MAESEAFGASGPFAAADGFYSSSGFAGASVSHTPLAAAYLRPSHAAGAGAYSGSAAFGAGAGASIEDYENEPPLLEELGVDFGHIRTKVTAVLLLHRPIEPHIMADADLAGPLVFCLVLGMCLLLSGKLHFGYIYGFGLLGCIGMYVIASLMLGSSDVVLSSDASGGAPPAVIPSLDFSKTFSLMGYCLLPIVLLAALAIFVRLQGALGGVLACTAIVWSTLSCARFFEAALGMGDRKWLVAYPAGLFYACFALMAIF